MECDAYWLVRAYEILYYLNLPIIKLYVEESLSEKLKAQIIGLGRLITYHCHSKCLEENDWQAEIQEGGILYCFRDGTIAGFNQFVLDYMHIISDNPGDLLIYK